MVRLQKYLAECGICARRKAEVLITEGRVAVNGVIVTELGTKVEAGKDRVAVDGVEVGRPEKGILLLHKPRCVMSTLSDPEQRLCIAQYITKQYRSYFPVGRLDYESSGLVILTNDGELAERLLHPRYQIDRLYEVEVEGYVDESSIRHIEQGVELEDGIAVGEARFIDHTNDPSERSIVQIKVREGRNRLVRRMMDAIGHPVITLVRLAHGPLRLDRIRSGEVLRLTQREYESVRREVFAISEMPR